MRPPKGKNGGNAGKEKTKAKQPNAPRSDENDATDFHSASEQDDVTDYGLEFTTSRLTLTDHNGQSRNSTLRPRKQTQAAAQRQSQQEVMDAPTDYEDDDDAEDGDEDDDDQENRAPISPKRHAPPRGRASQRQPNPVAPTTAARRKQARPINRARRMERQITLLQATPDLLIPRLPFSRLVREILIHYAGVDDFRITRSALEALQHSSEMFLTQRFQDSYLLTMHRQRVTLEVRDMALMAFFCKESVI